ncbi:MAG: T9SS type A sorting domain-containing protein [Saprospiraceae bacterium]
MRVGISILIVLFLNINTLLGQVFINEISYTDLNSNDRGIELAGPAGTDVNGWYMEFRDDNNAIYHTETINGQPTIDNENSSNRGGIWIPISGLQNQNDNTVILYDNNNSPQDTVSYGSNPFAGYTGITTGIGGPLVVQSVPGTTPQNLQNGNNDISWWVLQPATKGDLNGPSQLPVNLISFEAIITNNIVQLLWATASEENNSHFKVERSTDGITYEIIGTIEGNGTTIDEQTYDFEDNNASEGRNYYRLKQVDYDGKFEYSGVITVDFSQKISVTIAPNPITKNSKLNIQLTQYENVNFVIFDMTGKIVKTYFDINETGIYINDLDNGMYIYQIRQQERILKTDKLIIID